VNRIQVWVRRGSSPLELPGLYVTEVHDLIKQLAVTVQK
jgi:hypothetical protein